MNTENTNAAKELPKVLTFGENNEWAVHHDDGCLIFHPQWNINPHKTSIWIWKEAWEFVQNQGGFDNLVSWFRDTEIKGGHTELKEEIKKLEAKTKYLIPYCFECGAEYEDETCCPDKSISYIHPRFLKELKEAKFGVQQFKS